MLFKGIALFTPGGDLIYCLDPSKQERWHWHLCVALQEILGLSEPPHFLVPGYTATVDKWLDPHSGQIKIFAEAFCATSRYQSLLNVIFDTDDLIWQIAPWQDESCNPMIIETYRQQFPQLWENHDLIVRLDINQQPQDSFIALDDQPRKSPASTSTTYVFRLFISRDSNLTAETFQTIHHILEQGLGHPYSLKIIDISKHPELAESNHISATPTLLRLSPQPVRRIVGELENIDRVLAILKSF